MICKIFIYAFSKVSRDSGKRERGTSPSFPNDLNKSKMGALLTNMANWRRCRQKVKTKRENKELPIRLDLGWGEDCALVRN